MQFSSVSQFKKTTQRGFGASLLVVALAFGAGGSAQASPLNLIPENPDIASFDLTIGYVAGGAGSNFTASGTAVSLNDGLGGGSDFILDGSFDLTARIDNSGILQGGTITIGGSVDGNLTPLLTGILTDIGFMDAGGDPLEFLFDVTGGSLSGIYGGTGGTILSGTNFANWATSYDNVGLTSMSDTFAVSPVPVPAAVWLFGSALLGLTGFRRHSQRKQA